MKAIINGEERDLPDGLTMHEMLAFLGLSGEQIAIERNLEIVPPSAYESARLASGDRIEIVQFVGGG